MTTLLGADILSRDNFWLELICCKTTTTRVLCLSSFVNVYPHFSTNISLGLFPLCSSISSFHLSVSQLIKKSYDPSIILCEQYLLSNPATNLLHLALSLCWSIGRSVCWSVGWYFWKISKTFEIGLVNVRITILS